METNKYLMRAEEVANILGVSTAFAYKLMSKLNKELAEKGYLVISGRINRKYFKNIFTECLPAKSKKRKECD